MALGIAPALATPNISFQKTPDGQIINVGDTATFTYTITNVAGGGVTQSDFPQLVDFLPGGGGIVWDSLTPECIVSGAPGSQKLECDFEQLPPGGQAVATAFGTPTSCTVLTSIATLEVDDNTPPILTDPGTIIVPCPAVFVIGDVEPHEVGDEVNFWGSQWWKNNAMSGQVDKGTSSFKGYASSSTNACPGTWVSRVGNTAPPPPAIGDVIQVIVTDSVTKKGPDIGGNIVQILNVLVGGDYGPAPGHKDFGTVLSVVCPGQP